MAGMLPGVEQARRRRCRLGSSGDLPGGSRRSPLCAYSTCHEAHICANSMHRRILNKGLYGELLGDVAREAKERLDERLRTQRASEINRHNSKHGRNSNNRIIGGSTATTSVLENVQREVFSSKKSSTRLGWIKKGRKSSEEKDGECVVCLEEYRAGDILVNLLCSHRFHWSCVAPWLESTPHCPCCRTAIFSQA